MLRTVCVRLALFFSLLAIARVGVATCDPSTDPDKSDIANARSAVAANCDCAGATSHGAYVRCAEQQADAVLTNKSCARFVKKCASRSTCGRPGFVTCCRTTSTGVTKCSIKRDPAKCVAPKGGSACVGVFTSCCDACGMGGCAMTTTTTTTTLPCQYFGGLAGCAGGCAAGASCGFIGTKECGCIMLGSTTTSTLPPECSTCGSLVTCPNGGGCPDLAVCACTTEGGALCVDSSFPPGTSCDTVQSCTSTADCATGTACIAGTCCSTSSGARRFGPFCLSANQCSPSCSSGAAMSRAMMTAPVTSSAFGAPAK